MARSPPATRYVNPDPEIRRSTMDGRGVSEQVDDVGVVEYISTPLNARPVPQCPVVVVPKQLSPDVEVPAQRVDIEMGIHIGHELRPVIAIELKVNAGLVRETTVQEGK